MAATSPPPTTILSSSTTDPTEPPYYILVSQTGLPPTPAQPGSSSLIHPIIQYQYADDPPSEFLPKTPGESVIVLDCTGSPSDAPNDDPSNSISMTRGVVAESLSSGLAVAGLKIVDAPGVVLNVKDGDVPRNDKMYIIETLIEAPEGATVEESVEMGTGHALIAQFKQRNAAIKRVVDAPLSVADKHS